MNLNERVSSLIDDVDEKMKSSNKSLLKSNLIKIEKKEHRVFVSLHSTLFFTVLYKGKNYIIVDQDRKQFKKRLKQLNFEKSTNFFLRKMYAHFVWDIKGSAFKYLEVNPSINKSIKKNKRTEAYFDVKSSPVVLSSSQDIRYTFSDSQIYSDFLSIYASRTDYLDFFQEITKNLYKEFPEKYKELENGND